MSEKRTAMSLTDELTSPTAIEAGRYLLALMDALDNFRSSCGRMRKKSNRRKRRARINRRGWA